MRQSNAATTQAEVDELVAAASLPAGYSLQVRPQRRFVNRSLWAVRVKNDGRPVFGRAFYNPAIGIAVATAVAWGDSARRAA